LARPSGSGSQKTPRTPENTKRGAFTLLGVESHPERDICVKHEWAACRGRKKKKKKKKKKGGGGECVSQGFGRVKVKLWTCFQNVHPPPEEKMGFLKGTQHRLPKTGALARKGEKKWIND